MNWIKLIFGSQLFHLIIDRLCRIHDENQMGKLSSLRIRDSAISALQSIIWRLDTALFSRLNGKVLIRQIILLSDCLIAIRVFKQAKLGFSCGAGNIQMLSFLIE